MSDRKTFAELAKTDSRFIECCDHAGAEKSRRQYSKYKNKRGKAYAASLNLKSEEGK